MSAIKANNKKKSNVNGLKYLHENFRGIAIWRKKTFEPSGFPRMITLQKFWSK